MQYVVLCRGEGVGGGGGGGGRSENKLLSVKPSCLQASTLDIGSKRVCVTVFESICACSNASALDVGFDPLLQSSRGLCAG